MKRASGNAVVSSGMISMFLGVESQKAEQCLSSATRTMNSAA